jgi:ribonuclease III
MLPLFSGKPDETCIKPQLYPLIRRVLRVLSPANRKFSATLKNMLGFHPGNLSLYHLAFRHKSSIGRGQGRANSNERLEYLGDAILGAVVADLLFKKYPYKDEGFLTEMRSKIVSRENLNKLALKLGLNNLIETGDVNNPKNRSMTGDAFEALIGAVYLDKGYLTARRFILNRIIRNHVDIDALQELETNYKSRLIEWGQKEKKSIVFDVVEEISEGRNKQVRVHAVIGGEAMGAGVDFSKKKAEQIAAEKACLALGI